MGHPVSCVMRVAAVGVLLAVATACVSEPWSRRADVRRQEYFMRHPELPPSITDAIQRGHVIKGMDRDQVWTALGAPDRRIPIGRDGLSEIWLYRRHGLHQEQLRGDTPWIFRLVFFDGILSLVEPG